MIQFLEWLFQISLPFWHSPALVLTVQVWSLNGTSLKNYHLLQLFSCPKITRQALNVRVIDDRGHLEKGEGPCALRDVLSSLWQHIFASVTLGHVEKVLPISHNHQRHEREVIGLVVLNGFKETGYVPLYLHLCGLSTERGQREVLVHVWSLCSFPLLVLRPW